MDSTQLVFDVQLTQKEYSNLNVQHQKKSLIIGFFFYFFIFLATVLGVNQFELEFFLVAVGTVGGIVISILITILIYFFVKFQSNRHFKSDVLLQYKQTYEINDSGISLESISGKGHINWHEIFKVVESKHIIALYIGRNRALILLKETISKQKNEGVDNLKTLIINNLPKNKVKF